MTRVPLQLWAEVSEDGQRCAKTCPHNTNAWGIGDSCELLGELRDERVRHDACIAAEQAAREAELRALLQAEAEWAAQERARSEYIVSLDVPPSDGGARQTDEHERVCSENARLREQLADLTARGVVIDKDCRCGSGGHPRPCEKHPHQMAMHIAELELENRCAEAESENARLREREARVRALCLDADGTDVYDRPRLELPQDVLAILDDDEKDGEG